jgi:hypothetical protein
MAAFARAEGLDAKRIGEWKRRLEGAAQSSSPQFVQVMSPARSMIEIALPSGLTLRVEDSVDERALARIIGALSIPASC